MAESDIQTHNGYATVSCRETELKEIQYFEGCQWYALLDISDHITEALNEIETSKM